MRSLIPKTSPGNAHSPSPFIAPQSSPAPTLILPILTPKSALPLNFSPPLIAMVALVATAFFIVTYFRLISRHILPRITNTINQIRHRWRLYQNNNIYQPDYTESPDEFYLGGNICTYGGLDEDIIKTLPLHRYKTTNNKKGSLSLPWSRFAESRSDDCAVCLLEFTEDEYIRSLPICKHCFHVDCINEWLRWHANCPLCRAGIFRPDSPFVPMVAGNIRPPMTLHDETARLFMDADDITEVEPFTLAVAVAVGDADRDDSVVENLRRDFLLKRSYSFGFERGTGSDRFPGTETASPPWRYRRFKRLVSPSPFGGKQRERVFSFRSLKSPLFFTRRSSGRNVGLFPLSESHVRLSSRRSKSMTSPMFIRSSGSGAVGFSSRMRCGDLEALLSPDRLNQR